MSQKESDFTMITLEQPNQLIELAKAQLLRALEQHQTKPYLPVWGEIFTPLRELAKLGQRTKENILIYTVQPSGSLWYLYKEQRFMADIPEPGITISLTQEQLIDALLKGSFAPAKE
jgi:hypothetical protein